MLKSFEREKFSGKACVVSGFFLDPEKVFESTKDYDLCFLLGSLGRKDPLGNFKSVSNLPTKYIYIVSYKDLLFADFCGFNPEAHEAITWLMRQNVSASLIFSNFARYVFVGGSIRPEMKDWAAEKNKYKLAYENENLIWAKEYDGRFGYIVAAQNGSNEINYYQHSCVLGHRDKPIILNVDDKGIEYVES